MIGQKELQDAKVCVQLKLAALWASLMFLYIYVDYFHLYMPGEIGHLMSGKVYVFQITQTFLVATLAMVSIPALMIFGAVALPAKANRLVNLVVASVYIPFTLFNLAGVAWAHMVFAAVVEVLLLCAIVYYACTWPRVEG